LSEAHQLTIQANLTRIKLLEAQLVDFHFCAQELEQERARGDHLHE
jgi:hypothetical protein